MPRPNQPQNTQKKQSADAYGLRSYGPCQPDPKHAQSGSRCPANLQGTGAGDNRIAMEETLYP